MNPTEWNGDEELIQLGKELPWAVPDRARLDEVRAAVVAAAQRQAAAPRRATWRQAPWRMALAAALLLAVGLGLRWLWPAHPGRAPEEVAQHRGTVRPLGQAQYVHSGPAQDEIVRLAEGTIVVEVQPLRRGERFRVITADGQVEVRGTLFEVSALEDHLSGVRVLRGLVEVRPADQAPVLLHAEERWSPPALPVPPDAGTVAAEEAGAPAPAVHDAQAHSPGRHRPRALPPLRLAEAPPPAPGEAGRASPAERAFAEGMDALRAGQYAPAAESFGRAVTAAAGQPLAEDARYWRAVAWARAGRPDEAIAALRDFLRRHPDSPRGAEVASILGWQLFDRGEPGDREEAERLFRSAEKEALAHPGHPLDAVLRSAQKGLAAIAALRARK